MARPLDILLAAACAAAAAILPPALPASAGVRPRQSAAPASPGPWPQVLRDGERAFTVFAPRFRSYAADVVFDQPVRRGDGTQPGAPGDAATDGRMTVRAAVSPGADDGELELHSFTVDSLAFGGTDAPQADVDALQRAIGGRAIGITRRALLHDMRVENARGASTPDLGDLQPSVRVERRRAVLLQVHGSPRVRPLGRGGWGRVVNTPWILLQSPEGNLVARIGPSMWVSAPDVGRDFVPCDAPPVDVSAALGSAPRAGAGDLPAASAAPAGPPPALVAATDPAVLVSVDGDPALAPVAPGVEWATNAHPTLLRTAGPETWWVLACGRWFRAASLDGPWGRAAAADLPGGFALLPGGRLFDAVKASVPGTPEAVQAVAAAGEARSVRVVRSAATCTAAWFGAPAWLDIPGTGMRGSANASEPVVECRGAYYCCEDAVWFRADSPSGPWSACDDLPDEFASIPAASPFFPLSAVTVVAADAGSITFAYTPAYLGTCVEDGAVVFGTGWEVPWVPLGEDQFAMLPQPYPLSVAFDADTGTFAPDCRGRSAAVQPALLPEALVGGWPGWSWCSGWTSAWAWAWTQPGSAGEWPAWWRRWNPYWNRWANARSAEQRRRDEAAAAELADRQAEEDAADRAAAAQADEERRELDAQEAAWRERQAADRRAALEAEQDAADARAQAARFADRRSDERVRADAAGRAPVRTGPTAPRGSIDWWYQFYNDYSNGYLSRATGYRDPRYAPGAWGAAGPR